MGNKTDATMTEVGPYKLKCEPRECEICGWKYIPTSNRQKYCPECKILVKRALGDPEEAKKRARYYKHRTPGEVVVTQLPANPAAGLGGRGLPLQEPETPEKQMQQPERPEEVTRQVIETPETGAWYEARITKGKTLMLEAKIHPDMLAMIIKEVR